jgi:hypothetical protein
LDNLPHVQLLLTFDHICNKCPFIQHSAQLLKAHSHVLRIETIEDLDVLEILHLAGRHLGTLRQLNATFVENWNVLFQSSGVFETF